MPSTTTAPPAAAPADTKVEQTIVILSTGRTGTMALAHHYDTCYEQVTGLHEPKPSRLLRLESNRFIAGRTTPDELREKLRRGRKRLLARLKTPVYIESNWFIYGYLDVLRDVFPGPRVVHVVRDPRTCIPSFINFGAFRGLKWWAANFLPYWYLKPEQFEKNPAKTWADMSEVERVAWHWKVVNTELNRAKELFGDGYLLMKFEDLFAKDGSGVRRLTDWIGLPQNEKMLQQVNSENVNASPKYTFPKWKDWDEPLKQSVLRMCGPLMDQYGYVEPRSSTSPA